MTQRSISPFVAVCRVPARTAACLLLCACAFALAPAASARAEPAVSALVRVQTLQRGELTQSVDGVGTVQTAGGRTLQVSFARPVLVREVLVRAGQTVRRGEPLLVVAATPAARATYLQASDALRFARAQLQRVQALAKQQLATRSQLDAARKAVADARAALAAATAQGLGRLLQRVDAPFDGVVDAVATAPGARLAAGVTALSLAPSTGLQAVVGVDPHDALRLRAGSVAHLRAVFDPSEKTRATVLSVAGRVDPASGRVDVALALPATAHWLLPGLAVQASMPLRAWRGWVVPRQSVLRDAQGRAYVFQDDHGRARRVAVEVEADEGERSAISGPLQPALPLVVLGNYELRDGMALRLAAARAGQAR